VRATQTRQRGQLEVGGRVLFAFPVYFVKHYLQRQLFRSGIYGFALAAILAYGRWLRDAKMYEAIVLARRRKAEAQPAAVVGLEAVQEKAVAKP